MGIVEELAAEEEGRDLRRELSEVRSALRRAQRKLADKESKLAEYTEAVYRAARDGLLAIGHPDPLPPVPKKDKRKSPEVALLHFTDWQLGKRTPSYNSDICERRVQSIVRKTVKLTEVQRADHPVEKLRIMLGGDMIENVGIFPGQAYEVDSGAFEQVFRAAALLEQSIRFFLGHYREIEVDEVIGNHGRLGKKGDHPREDNLDAFVYRIAREKIGDQGGRVKWNVPEDFYAEVVEGEYRALLIHGDQVKQWGGTFPGHGLLKKATAWKAGGIDFRFKDLYLGHLHQPIMLQMPDGGLLRMTPSTESGSKYASEFVGAIGRPAQRLNFVSPSKGIVTAEYLIWLDD